MKNLRATIFATTFIFSGLSNVNAQVSKMLNEKAIQSSSVSESTLGESTQKSNINGINSNSMPNRISMNVTVPKQTQGATFGEKVNSGKVNVTLVEGGCIVFFFLETRDTESIQQRRVLRN